MTADQHFAPAMRVHTPAHPYVALAGFIALAMLAALPSLWLDLRGTYAHLALPEWAPPAWLFGPVWTALYVLMGIAAWGIWKSHGWCVAMAFWLAQLALNAAWTPIFFGLHQPGWAFVEIVTLWFAIAGTYLGFAVIRPWTALLLTPYLTWVSYAAVLNFVIWGLNE